MEKIKATISKSTIPTLKFQRKSDFNKLLNFIEKETKELKNIKIPKISKKKGMNILGLGLLGLVGIFGAGFGGGEDEKEVKEEKFGIDKFMIGRVQKDKKGDTNFKQLKDLGKSIKFSTGGGVKFDLFNKNPFKNIKNSFKNIKFGSAANASSIESDTYTYKEGETSKSKTRSGEKQVGDDSINKTKTATATKNKTSMDYFMDPKNDPFGDPPSSPPSPNKLDDLDFREDYDKLTGKQKEEYTKIEDEVKQQRTSRELAKAYSKRTGKIQIAKTKVIPIGNDFFFDTGKGKIKLEEISFKGKDYYFIDARISSFIQNAKRADKIRELILFNPKFTVDDATGEIIYNPSKVISKPNIFKKFMNFYNQGRTPAEDTMKFFGKDGLIVDDFSKITRTDKAFKEGAKGLKGARPFKAFTPNMLKTGPTPLTRQLIERPFRSLFGAGSRVIKLSSKILESINADFAKELFKSKTKTGLFVIDLFFAGKEFSDLFLRPGDNVFTTVEDFFTAINNAVYRNDPEKLKYFVTRSRSSAPLFGVSNDMMRQKEINRNLKIKELKEAAAKTSITGGNSNNQNIIVVPQTTNNNKRGSGVRNRTTGGKKASFVPMDLQNPFADQIEYKLSK